MLAVRTPGAPQATRTVAQPAIPPSPLRDRVGYSDHVRFRGYFPVHFIPAYNLPVYASQWPLPDTAQNSVRGCSLGFTAAAISGDKVQRTCTAQRSSNRTCRFPASGFPAGFHREARDGATLGRRWRHRTPSSPMNDIKWRIGDCPRPCHLVPSHEEPAHTFEDVLVDATVCLAPRAVAKVVGPASQ